MKAAVLGSGNIGTDLPIIMRDTEYVEVEEGTMREKEIRASIDDMVKAVQTHVLEYRLTTDPILDGNKVDKVIIRKNNI